jgi:Tol biopolymer transport system component
VLEALLLRPGELVTREELKQKLWPSDSFGDFEHGLNAAVNRVRDALGDSSDNPRFVETLPRRGYRFIAPVNGRPNAPGQVLADNAPPVAPSHPAAGTNIQPHPSRKRSVLLPALAGLVIVLLAALAWLVRPLPPPRVKSTAQITNDGWAKGTFVSDGLRIYYTEAVGNESKFFQVSTQDGEPVAMPQLDGMRPLDISADHLQLLLKSTQDNTVWVASVLGSAPSRLGDLVVGEGARWSPSGDQIAYDIGREVRVARSDGSRSRILATAENNPYGARWSPDGRTIRFSVWTEDTASLWEISADGTRLRRLFPKSTDYSHWYGVWTPDGKYYIFMVQPLIRPTLWDIWAVRESGSWFHFGSRTPVPLTNGPLRANGPQPSPDGKRIFFKGILDRGELVRCDPGTAHCIPYLSGLAATEVDYSTDAKWIAYVGYPDASLWRSAVDGSQKLRLITPPLQGLSPRWAPDSTQIAFDAGRFHEPMRVYVELASGEGLRRLTNGECGPDGEFDPDWSPDGKSIVFGCMPDGPKSGLNREGTVLRIVDLQSDRISVLPGSQGLWCPRWSPDGRYIAALAFPGLPKLMLYDVKTHEQRELFSSNGAGWQAWSRDSQYVYFREYGGDYGFRTAQTSYTRSNWYEYAGPVYRVRVSDGKVESIGDLPALIDYGWVGIAPDGSMIGTRQTGTWEIYALDVKFP